MADFSKFRASSDLSDVIVAVKGKEHKLHKFPLYARSDYFCEMTRIKPDPEAEPLKVELPDFPGGSDVFGQVADFCYNMPINVNKDNVVAMRSAAEYLRMSGPGNLIEVSSKVLMDTISSAKINRFVSVVISMLMDCTDIGDMAEKAGVVDVCLDAFLECWVRPGVRLSTTGIGRSSFKPTTHTDSLSAFTRLSSYTTEQLDEVGLKCLLALKGAWFASLLKKASARGVSDEELGRLATKYISSCLEYERGHSQDQPGRDLAENKPSLGSEDPIDNDRKAECDLTRSFDDKKPRQFIGFEALTYQAEGKIPESPVQREEIGLTLDMIINALPDQALEIPEVTMEWLTKTIQAATLHKCQCRDKLVKVAGEKLAKLDPKDLSTISPLVLHSIVVDTSDQNGEKEPRLSRERACALVDKYLLHMASQGALSADDFRLLVSATLNYQRPNHDQLFEALTFVLKSDKQLSSEQRRELIEFINFDLLSEVSLQKALEEDLVPQAKIAQSALKLCSRLRGELASVKFIAQLQDEEVHKYSSRPVSFRQSTVPLTTEVRHTDSVTYKHVNDDTDIEDLRDGDEPAPAEPLPVTRLDSAGYIQDPLRAAQNVLAAARHRLNLPVYTGYRPTHLSRSTPLVYGDHGYLHHVYTQRELDLSLEEELDLERSFYGLDSRAARRPKPVVSGHRESGSRAYFPYTSHVHKF